MNFEPKAPSDCRGEISRAAERYGIGSDNGKIHGRHAGNRPTEGHRGPSSRRDLEVLIEADGDIEEVGSGLGLYFSQRDALPEQEGFRPGGRQRRADISVEDQRLQFGGKPVEAHGLG